MGERSSPGFCTGAAGVLVDGRLRDFDQLGGYGFATWCRGEAAGWGGDTIVPFAANVAVEIGGVCVVPGDYVYADASGPVVIPQAVGRPQTSPR